MTELYKQKNIFEGKSKKDIKKIFDFSKGYKAFISDCATERLCVKEAEKMALKAGFVNIQDKKSIKTHDKIYAINRGKNILLATIGEKLVKKGVNLVAAHIDAPRLDLKQVPLFEDDGLAYLKTHYYGGIKKYQWTAIPLALVGTAATKTKSVEICIGLKEDDPVFTISDLLPHLAADQMQKKASEFVEGESLNIIVSSIPGNTESDKLKHAVMDYLYETYGILEEDFISSDLEVVPAFKARDVGFDRSLIGGYGQDDRVCAYTSLIAALETEKPVNTAVTVLVDREEVGSMGNTGMQSHFFINILAELINLQEKSYSEIMLKRCISASACLSADVSAAFDPQYKSVFEKKNSALLGHGITMNKYTGSRGKSGSSEASAEFVAKIRRVLDENKVAWQSAELGKIDAGGGGTVAQYIANLNMDVLDMGIPLLSMHSPFEIASKADIYSAYEAYKAFLNSEV